MISGNVDGDCKNVSDHLNKIFNDTCPLKEKSVTSKMIENPWISVGIIKSIKTKTIFSKITN